MPSLRTQCGTAEWSRVTAATAPLLVIAHGAAAAKQGTGFTHASGYLGKTPLLLAAVSTTGTAEMALLIHTTAVDLCHVPHERNTAASEPAVQLPLLPQPTSVSRLTLKHGSFAVPPVPQAKGRPQHLGVCHVRQLSA